MKDQYFIILIRQSQCSIYFTARKDMFDWPHLSDQYIPSFKPPPPPQPQPQQQQQHQQQLLTSLGFPHPIGGCRRHQL